MRVYSCVTTPLETNTYLVANGNRGFLIDPGGDEDRVNAMIKESGVDSIDAVLLTHAHADHIGLAKYFQEKGAKIYLHKADLDKVGSYKNMGVFLNVIVPSFDVDVILEGGEHLQIDGLDVLVIHTPGHSKGSVCFIINDCIFAGDTIFCASYGRTDFYDGNQDEIYDSIVNKIFKLDGNYKIYCGHGPETTLELEKASNPILW